MEAYEYHEHTADIQFTARGKNLEEAFKNAARATMNIIVNKESVRPAQKKNINIKGKDLKALLYSFIEEIIFLVDAEQFIPYDMETLKINRLNKQYWLNTIIEGETANDKHEFKTQIKAATYNDMSIKEEKDQVTIKVVVDI